MNVGISGRGFEKLTDTQMNKIVNYTTYYTWVDFSKIGISK